MLWMLLVRDFTLGTTALQYSGKEVGTLQPQSRRETEVCCQSIIRLWARSSPTAFEAGLPVGCRFARTHLVGKMQTVNKSSFQYFPLWSLLVLPG